MTAPAGPRIARYISRLSLAALVAFTAACAGVTGDPGRSSGHFGAGLTADRVAGR